MSTADELGKLSALRDQGAISQGEFDRLKSDLISRDGRPTDPTSGGRRWIPLALVGVAVIAAVAIGALVLTRSDGSGADAAATSTVAVNADSSPATTAPLTTPTIGIVERRSIEIMVRDTQGIIGIYFGRLWAKNGASPTEIASCSLDAIANYFDVANSGSADIDPIVARYLVLICGGYSESDAKAAAEYRGGR